MQFKYEVPHILQAFIPLLKNQFLNNVKTIRTDNGLEVFGKEYKFFIKHMI